MGYIYEMITNFYFTKNLIPILKNSLSHDADINKNCFGRMDFHSCWNSEHVASGFSFKEDSLLH